MGTRVGQLGLVLRLLLVLARLPSIPPPPPEPGPCSSNSSTVVRSVAEIIWPTTVAAKWPHQFFTLARLHSRPRGGCLVSRHQDQGGLDSTYLCSTQLVHTLTSCRPCARSFFLWTTHAISIFMAAVASLPLHWRIPSHSLPFYPSNCPQQVRVCFVSFAVVEPWRCGNYTPAWQIHFSLARHLSICSFSSPTIV